MDIATSRSNYNSALEAYKVSVHKFLGERKKISTILFWGTAISLSLFIKFFVSPPVRHGNSISDLRTGMDGFIVICLCAVGGILCAWQARTLPVFNDLLNQPDPLSEKDYELALSDVNERLDEGDELNNQQKRLTVWSVGLFLV